MSLPMGNGPITSGSSTARALAALGAACAALAVSLGVGSGGGGELPPCPYVTTVAGGPHNCGGLSGSSWLWPQGLGDGGQWAGYRYQCGDDDTLTMAIR